jgi:hypothetical protein
MNFENFEQDIKDSIEKTRESAPLRDEVSGDYKSETETYRKFINGELNQSAFEEILQKSPERSGRIYFDTLPEFIVAVRKLFKNKEEADEILDHENAHALVAQQRGYNFRYALDFARDEKKILIIKLVRRSLANAGVHLNDFNKFGVRPTEQQLREDLVAIIEAPEIVTKRTLGESDKRILGRPSELD